MLYLRVSKATNGQSKPEALPLLEEISLPFSAKTDRQSKPESVPLTLKDQTKSTSDVER